MNKEDLKNGDLKQDGSSQMIWDENTKSWLNVTPVEDTYELLSINDWYNFFDYDLIDV